MRLHTLLLSVIAPSAVADVIHERRYADSGLCRTQRVDPDSVITFRIGLKQQDLEHAYEYLLNISHPSSQHYGKLWTAEEVKKTFAPTQKSIDIVNEWLVSNGIEAVPEDKGWLSFRTRIAHMEELLNAQYYEYENSEMDAIRIGCDQYFLPEHISKQIDFVTPGVALSNPVEKVSITESTETDTKHESSNFPRLDKLYNAYSDSYEQIVQAPNLTRQLHQCGSTITPVCIRALYNIPSPAEVASEYSSGVRNSLGVFENGGTYNQSDLDIWFTKYAPHIRNGTHPIAAPVNGAKITGEHRVTSPETALDLMEMYGLVYPQTITLYKTKTRPRQINSHTAKGSAIVFEDLLDALDGSFCTEEEKFHNESCGTYSPAKVVSISYGSAEILQPQAYLHRLCNEFMKLSLQGTTFTVSSGDYGVSVYPGGTSTGLMNGCIVRENYNASVGDYRRYYKNLQNGTIFDSQFPASCPYVLSVGATQLNHSETVHDPESAWNKLSEYSQAFQLSESSAGGFSNMFSRPRYQNDAIASYFSNHDPGYPYYSFQNGSFNTIGANGGIYNRLGRGIPDVSANGARFEYLLDGDAYHGSGTSCAAPIWGSIFTLINEKRSQAGKGPVGFVNPTLYQHPEVFNDIKSGKNPGCFTDGFSGVEGWDPITGLGTPDYEKLLGVFMSLP